jgi:hypothetical protein
MTNMPLEYQCLYPTIQATHVPDVDAYIVRGKDGKLEIFSRLAFDFFFGPPKAPEPHKQAAAKRSMTKRAQNIPAAIPASGEPDFSAKATSQAAVYAVLKGGPLTTAEIKTFANLGSVSAAIQAAEKLAHRGLIVRRECPETRLDKWFLVDRKWPASS